MALANHQFVKTFVASGDVAAYRLIAADTTDGQVIQAAAGTAKLLGVADRLTTANTNRIDVLLQGIAEVELGGTVAMGDLITADADGKGVATTTANDRYVGMATQAGAAGDVIGVLIDRGIV